MDISWTNGNGQKRAVFVKQGTSGSASPENIAYIANTSFGAGSQIGTSGWYCVYSGEGTSVQVTNLVSSSYYIVHVCEYNELGSYKKYTSVSALDNPKVQLTTTIQPPTTQASNISFSSVSAYQFTISWTNGSGEKRAVFMKSATSGTASPLNNTTYTANPVYSDGSQIENTGWYCVYNNTGSNVTVTGLSSNTNYIIQVCEYNGIAGNEKYLSSTSIENPKKQNTIATSGQVNQVFTYTGSEQTFTVPSSVDQITVKVWGAGGAGGTYSNQIGGGSGGYSEAILTVTPGSSLVVVVGGGGEFGTANGDGGLGGWPGGGYGTKGDASGGGGGGVTGVFLGSYSHENSLIIAGSGGGGTGYKYGGAGGGLTGNQGENGGSGGTQTAGGTGQTYGDDGSALQGGNGDTRGARTTSNGDTDGGGGGAGYFGGEGGFGDATGGGGGSGYVHPSLRVGTPTITTGTNGTTANVNPPNTADADYITGVGVGSRGTTDGGNGLVVIYWPLTTTAPTAQATNLVFSTTTSGENKNITLNYNASDDAESYLIVRKTDSTPTFVPVDGSSYTAGTTQEDSYILYSGSALSAIENSVSLNTEYYYKIFAFNGSDTDTKYLTNNPLAGNTSIHGSNESGQGVAHVNNTSDPVSLGFPDQGVTINFPDGTPGTELTVSKKNTAPASNFAVLPGIRGLKNLYFNINSSNSTPGNFTIVLDFSSLNLSEAQWNNFKIMKRANASSPWQDVTQAPLLATIESRHTDGIWGKFTISGLSSFSEFSGGEGATTHTVFSSGETGTGSLKQAISDAVDGDFIVFDTTAMGGNTITLSSPVIVDKDLTITGTEGGTILDGDNVTRVITINDAKVVRLQNLIIKNGKDELGLGGGVWNNGKLTMVNCVVSENKDEGSQGVGGIIQYSENGDDLNDELNLINCTITNNEGISSFYDDGIGGLSVVTGTVNIYNSIIWGNIGDGFNDIDQSITIAEMYNSLVGNQGYTITAGAHNIFEQDPFFAGSDINPTYPYSLLGISPAVDTGNNAYCFEDKDIRGIDRKLNKNTGGAGTIDIGAFEYLNDYDTLPVTLSSFTATYTTSNFVNIMWTTESESNMIGYHILRAENDDLSEALRMTNNIIIAHNQPETQKYSFEDKEVETDTEYFYWIQAAELDGTIEFFGPVNIKTGNIHNDTPVIPLVTQLNGAYPNPFNPSTTISFDIAETVMITIDIYNVKGQKVRSLINEEIKPGRYNVVWNGKNANNRNVSSGVYFFKMQAGEYKKINKVL